jgi:hypothetical protein
MLTKVEMIAPAVGAPSGDLEKSGQRQEGTVNE